MTEEIFLIDPNRADAKTLQTIPGIGPALAERIEKSRPFESKDDLLRVQGISPALLEKLKPFITFSKVDPERDAPVEVPPEEALPEEPEEGTDSESEEETPEPQEEEVPPETAADEELDEPQEQPAVEPAPVPAQVTQRPAREPHYITRGQAFWMSLTTAFFAFVLALAVTFSVFNALNNGLRYVSPGSMQLLANQVEDVQARAEAIETDVDSLRTRIDNFEALSGRVTNLETAAGEMETELLDIAGEVEVFKGQVEDMAVSVETLMEETDRFQAFLTGLSELLSGLIVEESNE